MPSPPQDSGIWFHIINTVVSSVLGFCFALWLLHMPRTHRYIFNSLTVVSLLGFPL